MYYSLHSFYCLYFVHTEHEKEIKISFTIDFFTYENNILKYIYITYTDYNGR